MPASVAPPPELAAAVAVLSDLQPMRRGSLTSRFMKCGKESCPCQKDPAARHGPYTEWSRVVAGHRESRYLDVQEADLVRAQLAAGHEFRAFIEAIWEAGERWADAELSKSLPLEAAEKGGSATSSRRRSKPRSPL